MRPTSACSCWIRWTPRSAAKPSAVPKGLQTGGNAVINLMRRAFPDQEKPQEEIWNIARRVLWDLACAHSGDELSRHFLLRPEAFFRSIAMVYVHNPLGPNDLLHDPSTLH